VRLQMIYTVATSAFCFCVWPTGVVLDTYGPRACCMMGAAFFSIGCALFAYSDAAHDFFLPGFVFMAIGGLPVVLSMMHLSELMPWLAGTIMTIFNVMIDVSSLDLQLFRVAVSAGLCTRQEAFTYYMAVPVAIFVTAPFLWPNSKYERAQTGGEALDDVVLDSPRSLDMEAAANDKLDKAMTRKQWLREAPFAVQMLSKEFIFCTLFTALQLLHINLYIGTVDDQLQQLPLAPSIPQGNATNTSTGDSMMTYLFLATERAGETSPLTLARSMEVQWFGSGRALSVSTVGSSAVAGSLSLAPAVSGTAVAGWSAADLCAAFAWILPLGGLACTWPVGAVLDNMPLSAAIFMLSLSALVHSVFAMAMGPFVEPVMQLAGFCVFAYYRAALFGTMATTIAFAFGHGNFGKLWGLLYAVSGLANFTIAPLALLAKAMGSYMHINAATFAVSCFLMFYAWWLRRQEAPEPGAADDGFPAAEHAGARGERRISTSYHSTYSESSSHSHAGFGNDRYAPRSSAPRTRRSDLEGGLLANAH
jgi:hypothetical protein